MCTLYFSIFVFYHYNSIPGHMNGACIGLQQELGRPLLWFACRHHVGEILLKHVWEKIAVEASSSPDVNVFKR